MTSQQNENLIEFPQIFHNIKEPIAQLRSRKTPIREILLRYIFLTVLSMHIFMTQHKFLYFFFFL